MKSLKLLVTISILCLNVTGSASAQPYSLNVVGYVNMPYSTADHLIGNPLYSTDNTISNLFQYNIPDGSTLTKWDRSIYHSDSGWSINYDLSPSEGALFHPTAAFTNTFTGEVPWSGDSPVIQPPTLGSGMFLLSCTIPFSAATFYQVVGRDPVEGESVTRLDSFSMTYYTTIYRSGEWDNGEPTLNIGEAGFFALGPNAITLVPEPATYALLTLGFAAFGLHRRFRRAG
jgi:PEP-CTERM motif